MNLRQRWKVRRIEKIVDKMEVEKNLIWRREVRDEQNM